MRLLLATDKAFLDPIRLALGRESVDVEVIEPTARLDNRIETDPPEAILLDQSRCKEPCAERVARWRSKGLSSFVLVLLGEKDGGRERIACLNAGADVCLEYPLNPDELRAQIRAYRRRQSTRDSGVRRIHDLEIDTLKRAVSRNGKAIRLTSQEFDLLQLLASRPGKVVNRSMILEHLYNDRAQPASNVVDVYIRYLRNKIDKDSAKPLILTRWGQGYVFREEEEV
jgi:DNA-binding response OmpR family regulator